MGSEKKGILLLPDLLENGYIFEAFGHAWLQEVDGSGHTVGASSPTTFEFSDLGVGQLCFQKK